MWNKKFGYVLNYFENFSGSSQKQSTDAITATKKINRVNVNCLFQSLYSSTVAETVKKDVSDIKQKKVNTTIEFCTFELI